MASRSAAAPVRSTADDCQSAQYDPVLHVSQCAFKYDKRSD